MKIGILVILFKNWHLLRTACDVLIICTLGVAPTNETLTHHLSEVYKQFMRLMQQGGP